MLYLLHELGSPSSRQGHGSPLSGWGSSVGVVAVWVGYSSVGGVVMWWGSSVGGATVGREQCVWGSSVGGVVVWVGSSVSGEQCEWGAVWVG